MSATLNDATALRAREAAVLALTLFAEAGHRPVRALEALASVVLNRVASGRSHWGQGIEAVCRAPFQFPCWNPRHSSHAALRAAAPGGERSTEAAMAVCRRIAARAVAGALPDSTGGATHYHGDDAQPGWAVAQLPVAEIGGLLFYRLSPAAPPAAPAHPRLAAVG